jgi:hypothetical protein
MASTYSTRERSLLARGRRPRSCSLKSQKQRRSFLPRVEALEGRTLPSVLMVTNVNDSGKGSLRAQVAAADPGDTIKFAAGLTGQTITLTSGQIPFDKPLAIEGLGASKLAVSGNNASRIFDIGPDASTVTIAGLTLKNGLGDPGGAILDDGSSLTLNSDTFRSDVGAAVGDVGEGGALAIFGESTAGMTVAITNCQFVNDTATGGDGGFGGNLSGSPGQGGAIYLDAQTSAGLVLAVSGTSFTSDSAMGGAGANGAASPGAPGAGGAGGMAQGGAVWLDAGEASQPRFSFSLGTFSQCTVTGGAGGNGVDAGAGGIGGEADGGALYYTAGFAAAPTLSVATVTFTSNTAKAGNGGAGGGGTTAGDSSFGGAGGGGGTGAGGAVFADFQGSAAGTDNFAGDSFHRNAAIGGAGGAGGADIFGGDGGSGGQGLGGGLEVTISDFAAAAQLTIARSAITNNTAQGGNGGAGGSATILGGNGGISSAPNGSQGGGLFITGIGSASSAADPWTLDSDNIAFNAAIGGNGGAGGDAARTGGNGGESFSPFGGGIAVDSFAPLEILHTSIIDNRAVDGQGGQGGSGVNPGSNGPNFPGSFGGGLATAEQNVCKSADSLIAGNQADSFPDVFGFLGNC